VLMRAADIPATYDGLVPFQVQNALAAAAACWGAGVPIESIRLGLKTFQADEKNAPGRFNLFNVGRARAIVDYGHNPHALKAIQAAIGQMRPRRTIAVVAAPGDRRDADIQELAVIAANTFDWIIVREDYDLRGRERGEVAHLIADTIARTRPSLPVTIVEDEEEAVAQALEMARANDLVVVFVDRVEEAIAQIKRAGRGVAIEESDSFWCPLPDSSPVAQRTRAQAMGEAVGQDGHTPPGGGDGSGPHKGSNGKESPKSANVASGVAGDEEPEGQR